MSFEDEILDLLRRVYDPEIRVDIVELGLVYGIQKKDDGLVHIKMTLTAPGCPVSDQIIHDVKFAASRHKEVTEVDVELVWEPPWNRDMMSEEAKLMLGYI